MITWHIGTKCLVAQKREKDRTVYTVEWYRGDANGTQEAKMTVDVCDDGTLTFSDYEHDGGFIYFYPEMTVELKKILEKKR